MLPPRIKAIYMAIDANQAGQDYVSGATAKVDKLVRKYTARTDKLARATSDEAQKNYVAGVTDPVSQKLRLVNLKKLSEADLNKGMEEKGRTAYSTGVGAAQNKYVSNVQPYLSEIDRIKGTLKPHTRDARANVMERVLPLSVGLANKKRAMIGK